MIVDTNDYIVVIAHDGVDEESGPLSLETFIKYASIENAMDHIKRLGNRYGECRIAKLVYLTEDEVNAIINRQDQEVGKDSTDVQ